MTTYRTGIKEYFRKRDRGWVLSLIAVVCLLYLPFLASPFVFDDLTFFLGGLGKHYAESWFHLQLRWLPYASLGWTELFFSTEVTHLYHLGNLALHASNVVLLFYLLRQLLAAGSADERAHDRTTAWGAWLAALIFAVHPVAVYAAGYVVERSILMATFFALLTQLAYVRGLLTGQPRWLLLAAAAYFMAVFSKEHSVMTLAILAAETLLLRDRARMARSMLGLAWAAMLATGILVAMVAKGVLGVPYEAMATTLFAQQGVAASTSELHLLSVLTQAGLFFKYLLMWLVPNPAWMSIDMREPFITSLTAWQGWLGAAGFAAYGALGFWLLLRPRQRWAGLLGLAMLYPWLQFTLEFSSVRVQEPFVLYRSYLWMPGLLLLVPLLLEKFPRRRTFVAAGLAVVLLLPLAANRLWVFSNDFRLWNDAARLLSDEHVVGADRIFYNRGQAERGMGKLPEALVDFQRAAAISPQHAPIHFELGWTYFVFGRDQDARVEFDAAIALDPKFANAYFGKAMLLKRQGDSRQATELMARSCELKNAVACLIVNKFVTQ